MKFLFYFPRRYSFTDPGRTTGGGMSGTTTSLYETIKNLVIQGHTAAVVHEGDIHAAPLCCDGIDAFSALLFDMDCDVREIVSRLPSTCRILAWQHCVFTPVVFPGARETIYVCPSTYVQRSVPSGAKSIIVSNGIDTDLFATTVVEEEARDIRSRKMVFHAVFERGGAVAHRVFEKLGFSEFHIASYHDDSHTRQLAAADPAGVRLHGSLEKADLIRLLTSVDYFVYPLSLPPSSGRPGFVHHDTYACVVHEAMACGVIVITWDVACLRELYGDAIVTIETPPFDNYDPHAPVGNYNHAMHSDHAVESLCEAVRRLEADPAAKERLREKARTWALSEERSWAAATRALVDGLLR